MEEKLEELKKYINENYKVHRTSWTYQRSEGNYCDVFDDGMACGEALTLYEIGTIIGMELELPEEAEDDDF